jgi:hypothetical protein
MLFNLCFKIKGKKEIPGFIVMKNPTVGVKVIRSPSNKKVPTVTGGNPGGRC